jgi:hypothetical protein
MFDTKLPSFRISCPVYLLWTVFEQRTVYTETFYYNTAHSDDIFTLKCKINRDYCQLYVCMYVCMYMYVCTYVCKNVRMYACTHVRMYVYVCTYVCKNVRMYACTYVCMYAILSRCEWHNHCKWTHFTFLTK